MQSLLEPKDEEQELVTQWEKTLQRPAVKHDVRRNGILSDLFDRRILQHLQRVFDRYGQRGTLDTESAAASEEATDDTISEFRSSLLNVKLDFNEVGGTSSKSPDQLEGDDATEDESIRMKIKRLEATFDNMYSSNENQAADQLYGALPAKEFRVVMQKYIPPHLVETIYRAIDVSDLGYVKYSDFTNYLIASEAGDSFSSRTYTSRLVLYEQQPMEDGHKDFIDCMVYARKPVPMVLTGTRDGQLSMWDPETLKLITRFNHKNKSTVYQDELKQSMSMKLKSQTQRFAPSFSRHSSAGRQHQRVAITSMCPFGNSGMICVGSADGCVTIYDLATQEVIGRYSQSLESFPTAVECFYSRRHVYSSNFGGTTGLGLEHGMEDSAVGGGNSISAESAVTTGTVLNFNELPIPFMVIGTAQGHLHIVAMHPEFGLSTEVGMKKKNQQLFARAIQNPATIVGTSCEWITQCTFIPEVDSVIVSGTSGIISFVETAKWTITKSFTAHHLASKIGVQCFSWSSFGKYIVSAADRVLLFWDPFTLEIGMRMDSSLKSPVRKLQVSDEHTKIFAILADKTIFVWHSITYELMQQITDPTVYKPQDVLCAMSFAPDLKCLFTAGNRIASWNLERASESEDNFDDQDLVAALYNSLFNQIILVKSLGLVKVYQAESGSIVRQFSALPLDSARAQAVEVKKDPNTGVCQPIIKSAVLDKNESRLIVTSFDLSVQFWNINDGSNLLQLKPQLYSTTLAHIYANLNRSITALQHEIVVPSSSGNSNDSGRRDSAVALNASRRRKRSKKLMLISTEHGNICGYQENNSVIEEEPVFFLRIEDCIRAAALQQRAGILDSRPKKLRFHQLIGTLMNRAKEGANVDIGGGQDSNVSEAPNAVHFENIQTGQKAAPSDSKRKQFEFDFDLNSRVTNEDNASPNKHHHPHHNPVPPALSRQQSRRSFTGRKSVIQAADAMTAAPKYESELQRTYGSSEHAVLWLHALGENSSTLMVGHLSGLLMLWNLEAGEPSGSLDTQSTGPVLMAMRKKGQRKETKVEDDPQNNTSIGHLFMKKQPEQDMVDEQERNRSESINSLDPDLDETIQNESAVADITPDRLVTLGTKKHKHNNSAENADAEIIQKDKNLEVKTRDIALDKGSSFVRKATLLHVPVHIQKSIMLKRGSEQVKALIAAASKQARKEERQRKSLMIQSNASKESDSANQKQDKEKLLPVLEKQDSTTTCGSDDSDEDVDHVGDEIESMKKETNLEQLPESGQIANTSKQKSIARHHASIGLGQKQRDSAADVVALSLAFNAKMRTTTTGPGMSNASPNCGPSELQNPLLQQHRRITVSLSADRQPRITNATINDMEHNSMNDSLLSTLPEGSASQVLSADTSSLSALPSTNNHSTTLNMRHRHVKQNDKSVRDTKHDDVRSLFKSSVLIGGEIPSDINQLQPATLPAAETVRSDEIPHELHNNSAAGAASSAASHTSASSSVISSEHHTKDSESTVTAATASTSQPVLSKPKVVVESIVVLERAQVVIGACSDRYLRFWDLNTNHVLCSCLYYHSSPAMQRRYQKKNKQRKKSRSDVAMDPAADAPLDEILRILRVSDSEDLLIGGYDSGIIRVWTVQSYSIVTLRGLLKKHLANTAVANVTKENTNGNASTDSVAGFGDTFPVSFGSGAMAISPITLLKEWTAHESPLLSLEYVWFDYQKDLIQETLQDGTAQEEDGHQDAQEGQSREPVETISTNATASIDMELITSEMSPSVNQSPGAAGSTTVPSRRFSHCATVSSDMVDVAAGGSDTSPRHRTSVSFLLPSEDDHRNETSGNVANSKSIHSIVGTSKVDVGDYILEEPGSRATSAGAPLQVSTPFLNPPTPSSKHKDKSAPANLVSVDMIASESLDTGEQLPSQVQAVAVALSSETSSKKQDCREEIARKAAAAAERVRIILQQQQKPQQAEEDQPKLSSIGEVPHAGGSIRKDETRTSEEDDKHIDASHTIKRVKREWKSDMGQDPLEGFVLSAGLDQKVYLWNVLTGRCVGEFGSFGWDINSEATWTRGNQGTALERKARRHAAAKKKLKDVNSTAQERNLRIETSASNITQDNVSLVKSPSSLLIQNIGKHKRQHSSMELNDYVVALTRKLNSKPPSYIENNKNFHEIMTKHPMVDAKLPDLLKSKHHLYSKLHHK